MNQAKLDYLAALARYRGLPDPGKAYIAIAVLACRDAGSRVTVDYVRGALGDIIPGAVNIAARAFGVPPGRLLAMLENGEILASDFVERFVNQFDVETRALIPRQQGATAATLPDDLAYDGLLPAAYVDGWNACLIAAQGRQREESHARAQVTRPSSTPGLHHRGHLDIPPDILTAAETLHRFFAERGIEDWKLGDVQSRQDYPGRRS